MTHLYSFFRNVESQAGADIAAGLGFLLWVIALFAVKKIVFGRARFIAKKTSSRLDDVLVESLDFPLTILILASGVGLLRTLLTLDVRTDHLLVLVLKSCVVLAAMGFGNRLVDSLLKNYGEMDKVKMLNGGITRGLIKAGIAALGALVFLEMMGVSITPVLASLGIGSLAVALALQDTLSNLFAGIHLMVDKPLRLGDFVRLETGQEGTIREIGWRSTRLQTPANNTVVLPNNKLTSSVLTNFNLPDSALAIPVDIGVHYNSDLEHVQKVTCAVATQILQTVPGGVGDFEPFVRYHGLGESAVQLRVVLRGQEFADKDLLVHEFLKALLKRYAQEKILIPFPTRTVEISGVQRPTI